MPSPTPTLDAVKAAVVLAVQTAMNSGNPASVATVFSRRVFWRDYVKFNALFKRTSPPEVGIPAGFANTINGYRMRVTEDEKEFPEWYRFARISRFQIEGFLGINDSGKTESDFINQVGAVCDQLRLLSTVFGNTEIVTPVAKIDDMDVITLGEYTAWYAKISLDAERIVTVFS